jgi:hypothetical protein
LCPAGTLLIEFITSLYVAVYAPIGLDGEFDAAPIGQLERDAGVDPRAGMLATMCDLDQWKFLKMSDLLTFILPMVSSLIYTHLVDE